TNLEVFGQDKLLAGSQAALRVRLTDGRTHAPMAGVPIDARLYDPAGVPWVPPQAAQTDANGTCQISFDLTKFSERTGQVYLRAATQQGDEVLTAPVTIRRAAKLMLSSDKPVYQPGQTIRLRALTLRRPDLKPVAETAA